MKCSNCGTELRDEAKFCDECGEKQGSPRLALFSDKEIAEIEARSQPDEYASKLRQIVKDGIAIERRDVAVLFVDVSGFAPLLSMLTSEQAREIMRDIYSVMSGAITRCRGYVDKFIGDEVMAIFGAPIALERPCERAITAVDEIEIGLTAVNHRFKGLLSTPIAVHAGIAFGAVEAGRLGDSQKLEYTFLGQTVNLAKRLADAAFARTVLVSSQVKRLAEETFDFESLGVQQLSGVSKPLEVFRLVGPKPVVGERIGFSELGASMFGRDNELDTLKAAFGKLQSCYPDPKPGKPGEGRFQEFSHIFGITGEAGIGKSRLKREFKWHLRELLGRRGFRFLGGGTWAIGQTPLYWPIKEQVASALGFETTSSSEATADGLLGLKEGAGLDAEFVPYIHHLFGLRHPDDPVSALEPKAIKDNVWLAIRRLYQRWSETKPLVVVFEDMHWADGGTADFVEYLAGCVADFPILILLLYRPGYQPKFARRTDVPFTEMNLQPLSSDAETDLLNFYLAPGERERALIGRLRRYSEGNPLFAEEFLHLLLERAKLELRGDKMYLTEEIEEMPLPMGLSGVLGERFDRLPRRVKQVAYYGAVIGRSFPYSLLCDLHGSLHGTWHVHEAIQTLLAREIVFEKAVEPELEYIFKHALTREILVSRLVESLRRDLSKLIATRVEKLYEDRLDTFHGMLSEHWEAAGEIEKAVRSAALWGIYNGDQQRNLEAQAAFKNYDRLCERVTSSPLSAEEQSDLLVSRIEVLTVLGSWDEAIFLCEVLAGAGDGRWRGVALSKKAWLMHVQGDSARSLSLGKEGLDAARRANDRTTEATALGTIGIVHAERGDWEQALRHFEEAISVSRSSGNRRGVALSLTNMGEVHSRRGNFDQALRCLEEALSIHRELGIRRTIAITLGNMGAVYGRRGNHDQALRYFEESLWLSRELGDRRATAHALNNEGMVNHERGDYDKVLRYYDEALQIFQELGDRSGIATVIGNMGILHNDLGRHEQALQCFDQALSIRRELGDRPTIGWALSKIAGVHADRGDWAEAKRIALQAQKASRSGGRREFLSESLSVLCRAHAAMGRWQASLSSGAQANSIADETQHWVLMITCRLALSEAHLKMARWYDEGQEGERPPLSRDDATAKATSYAKQAKELAQSAGMKGYVRKAEELLADIDEKK